MKREIARDQAYRLIACGPVTLVTSLYKGDMNVMTASWLSPVSYRPLLIGLSVHQATLTHELIKKGQEFAINVPTHELVKQVRYCGSVSGRDQNKLKATGLHEEGPRLVRPVLIRECIAHIECAVVDAFSPGDHTLFVAEIVSAAAPTPGRITASASRSAAGSLVIVGRPPTFRTALATERRLPAP